MLSRDCLWHEEGTPGLEAGGAPDWARVHLTDLPREPGMSPIAIHSGRACDLLVVPTAPPAGGQAAWDPVMWDSGRLRTGIGAGRLRSSKCVFRAPSAGGASRSSGLPLWAVGVPGPRGTFAFCGQSAVTSAGAHPLSSLAAVTRGSCDRHRSGEDSRPCPLRMCTAGGPDSRGRRARRIPPQALRGRYSDLCPHLFRS